MVAAKAAYIQNLWTWMIDGWAVKSEPKAHRTLHSDKQSTWIKKAQKCWETQKSNKVKKWLRSEKSFAFTFCADAWYDHTPTGAIAYYLNVPARNSS